MTNHIAIPDSMYPEFIDHSIFMAAAWGQVALDFIHVGNIGAASFAARSASVHAFHVLGGGE